MTRTLFIATALLLAPQALAGKHFITGTIQDRNGEPVDRAIVSLNPGNVQLVTDREGRFLIDYLRDEAGEWVRLSKKTDYQLEVFKPGFHTQTYNFYYKSKELVLETFTVVEETIEIQDHGENIDPDLYSDQTNDSGATYEGQ